MLLLPRRHFTIPGAGRSARALHAPAVLPLGTTQTHAVFNITEAWAGNAFAEDVVLRSAIRAALQRDITGDNLEFLTRVGAWAGAESTRIDSYAANTILPQHQIQDGVGRHINSVKYTPAYHALLKAVIELGVQSYAWRAFGLDGGSAQRNSSSGRSISANNAHAIRAAAALLSYQGDAGVGCPATMTFAGVPTLLAQGAGAFDEIVRKACTPVYEPSDAPMSAKKGLTLGMSMTEKQGGSDVRANSTRAVPLEPAAVQQPGAPFALRGHKWFTSAPMSDAFLTLAVTNPSGEGYGKGTEGLSCFLVPRWLPDGRRNDGFRIVRLKDKLGDRSNGSSEVEYDGSAVGWLLGSPGRGVAAIMDMVAHTRLDCALGSAGLMRAAVREATHHASQRSAFGTVLSSAPAMEALLCDLNAESAAAVALSMHAAEVFDECGPPPSSPSAASTSSASATAAAHATSSSAGAADAYRRLVTAVSKFYVCKQAVGVVAECMEVLGGNGYTESARWRMAYMYRQAPLNSIWEGTGNVVCLDIQRTLQKEPLSAMEAVKRASVYTDAHPRLRAQISLVTRLLRSPDAVTQPRHARYLSEQLALMLQGAALARLAQVEVEHAPSGGRESVDASISSSSMRSVFERWVMLRLGPSEGGGGLYGAVALVF